MGNIRQNHSTFFLIILVHYLGLYEVQSFATVSCNGKRNLARGLKLDSHQNDVTSIDDSTDETADDVQRRNLFSIPSKAVKGAVFGGLVMDGIIKRPAWAGNPKSRTDGYAVQKPDKEWKEQLSDMQYYVLRRGGTESPNFSILEAEERPGTFVCAGCGTELFDAKEKFHSGTGWPSFARSLQGVEVEKVNPITANLAGAELRCATCGGHLGDVFNDGYLFVGTPAFTSGKRFCIDGAALIFQPANDGEPAVRGDTEKPKSDGPSWLQPPSITPQS